MIILVQLFLCPLVAAQVVPGPVTDANLGVEECSRPAVQEVLKAMITLAEVRAAGTLWKQTVLHALVVRTLSWVSGDRGCSGFAGCWVTGGSCRVHKGTGVSCLVRRVLGGSC